MTHDEIVEQLGAEDFQQVIDEYSDCTLSEIKSAFDYMWPHEEDNDEFAQAVYEALQVINYQCGEAN